MNKPSMRRMHAHWGRKGPDGDCCVCTQTEDASASRWIASVQVHQATFILCPMHLRELQKMLDTINNPVASRPFMIRGDHLEGNE
jgi:hypothetical protein